MALCHVCYVERPFATRDVSATQHALDFSTRPFRHAHGSRHVWMNFLPLASFSHSVVYTLPSSRPRTVTQVSSCDLISTSIRLPSRLMPAPFILTTTRVNSWGGICSTRHHEMDAETITPFTAQTEAADKASRAMSRQARCSPPDRGCGAHIFLRQSLDWGNESIRIFTRYSSVWSQY